MDHPRRGTGVRYVAIGDSFTEGVGDELPDGSPRGWADLVASGLAAAHGTPVHYANLAVRGRLLATIVTDQLDAALALSPTPTMITINGGGNDMMRPNVDLNRLTEMTEQAARRCLDAGVQVVLLSGADPSAGIPFGRVVRRRGVQLTTAVARLAAHHDLILVDMFNDTEIRQPGYWSADRLHLNTDGHRRVASRVLAALGHTAPAHVIQPSPHRTRDLRTEARYYREHVLPWVHRRIRGRSSGDNLTGKYPTWINPT
jgi:lysophospholipase L1-like esterase